MRKVTLLFAVLLSLVGVTLKAETISEDFNSLTVSGTTLSNGWFVQGATLGTQGSTAGNWGSYSYELVSRDEDGTGGKSLVASYGSQAGYVIIPVELTGTISFRIAGTKTTAGSYSIHSVTESDGTYIVNTTPLKEGTVTKKSDSRASFGSWTTITYTYDNHSLIALMFNKAAIDNFSAEEYVAGGCEKPKSLSASDVTSESAVLSWTSGSDDQDTWQIVYSTDSDFDKDAATPITVQTTSYSLTGLSDNTTYYAAVRSYCSADEQSGWSSVNFTTLLAPISSFPWTETFNDISSGIPTGWDNTDGTTTTASYKWTSVSSGHDGRGVRFDSYSNSSNNTNFLKTPVMNFPAGDPMQLKFWYKNADGGDFSVYISNDGGATYTTELATGLTGASSWTEKVIDIPEGYGENVVIVFKGTSNWGSGDAYIYLDDVSVVSNTPAAVMEVSEAALAFGTITAESTNADKTKTFTISNTGTAALEGITVSYTGDDAFSTSPAISAQAIAVGGDAITVTVTMATSTVGDYSGTISVAATGQTPVEIPVTGSFAAAPATMAVTLDGVTVGETVVFGEIGKQATKTFTVTNDGNLKLNVTIASSNTTDFTVSPAALEVAGGSSETFTLTFVYGDDAVLDTEKTANITITPSNEGLSPLTFTVSGTRIEQWSEDFSGNILPSGWETTNETLWTVSGGVLHGKYNYTAAYLTTPSLIVESTSDALTFDYVATGNYVKISIEKSKNGGAWETCSTATAIGSLNTGNSGTATITGLEAGKYKFRFKSDDYDLDNFQGFKLNANDPRMGVYTDANCEVAAAFSLTKDFGFVTEDASVTYYIKNDGTGTMELEQDVAPAGFSAVLGKNQLAAGESTTLTITFGQISGGYRAGDIVLNGGDAGTFTVSVSGVMIDASKLNLDFATANIPSTWTANSWTKNANGYVEAGYSSTTMETGVLTATAGEQLVIVAKNTYASSSYTFGVKYKKTDADEWSDLIAAANQGTSWKALFATIEEAGDYLLLFTGNYAQIQHIYGLTEPSEPVMVVYDGESKAAATYSFGNVANDNDATHTFTVKNEGKAVLAGLTAALSGEQADHYSVAITGLTDGGVAAGEEATITVTQKKDNLGAHVATLTISSTSEGIADFVIALSGVTRDASKLYVDFEDGNVPEGWTNSGWTTSSKYASTGYGGGTLTTPALTVAVGETLSFDARKQYSDGTLTVRYTTDGGVNWTEQNYTNNFNNSGFSTQTLDLENESVATVIVQFVGRYVYIDNIFGFAPTTAPMLALTEGGNAVANGATKAFANLTAEGTATYTLTNEGTADMVTTVATTGVATAAISGEGEGITIAENTVTLAAGKSATITLTLPYEAPFGEKTGAMTLTSEGWVGEVTVNYTATTVDPTALYVDFANNAKPAGWYNSGFSFTSANATINISTEATLITEKLTVAGVDDVLTYDAAKTSSYQTAALVVSYSTDRQNWIPVETQPTLSSTTASTFEVKGLEAGDYYLQFKGKYATIDNIMGWHKASPAPDHDLFFVSIDVPEGSYIPGSEYTATVKVVNLRAESETVSAELFVKNEKADELKEQVIALDETKTFTLTATVPEEGKHLAYVKVYNNAITIETEPVTFASEHNLALEITDFALTSDAEATANAENQFTATFNVTVKNTSSRDLNAEEVSVTIVDAEGNPYQTATAAQTLAVNAETTISVSVTTSALEGGVFTFKAQEDRTGTIFATAQTVSVTAAAPKFDLAVKDGDAVSDGDAVAFGLVKEATTKTYTITNSGTMALELVSIVAPTGFEATALTDDNKTIAAEGTLDIDVTLLAEQGKKSGALVFTYKVDASTNKTFTLNLSGRSVAADTWTVDFEDGNIPADWDNSNNWTVGGSDDNHYATLTGWDAKSIMTPRLAAAANEELTFDVLSVGNIFTYAYSTDKTNWSDEVSVDATGEQSFIAPAAGNYYLRFTTRNGRLDNLVGFKANPLEHDTELAASSVPASAKQYNTYTATVTLKESAGKAEEVTATLYVGENDVTSTTQTITANGSTVITLTWEPQETISDAVNAYVAVTGTGIDLSTEPVSLIVAEVYTLDEATSASSIDAVTNETVLLKRTFIAGWNTVCLPFAISNVEAFFGEGAVAYDFTSYTDGMLNFTKVTSLTASIPYVVYVPKAIVEPMKLQNITISSYNTEGFYRTSNNAKFQGTYAPIAAGTWEASGVVYGLTKEAKIAKANTEKASIKGFRAYFDLPAGAEVKALRFDGLETGVRTISADEVDGQLFDINGRKVSKTQHGIYVVNGKKVIVK